MYILKLCITFSFCLFLFISQNKTIKRIRCYTRNENYQITKSLIRTLHKKTVNFHFNLCRTQEKFDLGSKIDYR